jgi:hypothetical protein
MPEKTSTHKEAAAPQQADRAAKAGGITKIEAVRQALAALGKDAGLAQLQGHIRDRLGVEMTTNHISDARGKILKREAGKGKVAQKPATRNPPAKKEEAREAPAEPQASKPAAKKPQAQKSAARKEEAEEAPARPQGKQPAPRAVGGDGQAGGIPLEDILAVKALVGRLGAERLHVLIDAFTK